MLHERYNNIFYFFNDNDGDISIFRLRGGEPIAFPHEFLIQADSITFSDIEMSLHHALPPSLRQFEKR